MKRLILVLAAVLLLMVPMAAMAEASFSMVGYDPSGAGHDWKNNFFFLRMNERTGVAFSYQQFSDRDAWTEEKLGYTKAGQLPDVLFKAELTPAETCSLYEKGVLIDLRPYLAEHAPHLTALLQAHPAWEKAITLPDGSIPALPYFNTLQNNNAIWINSQWLKNVGKAMPTTAEELTEVLRAFRNDDPNRNGRDDETPMTFTGMWDLRFLGHAFGIVSNDYYVTVENGTVRETVTSDANRAFLTWLHQLWEERLIDRLGFSTVESTRQITDAKAAITYGVVTGPSIMSLLPSEQLANYEVLLPLTYEGKQAYRDLLGDVVRGTFAVTSACKDPAAMVAWVDYLYSEEGCFLAQAGMLNEEYEVHSDGTWAWMDDPKRVADVILPEYTIAEGAVAPGYTPDSYQLNYDDAATHRAVEMLKALKDVSVEPYPPVYLTEQEQSRINELWKEIGYEAETRMAWFVTGDMPLNDQTWQEFCDLLQRLGLQETVSIWQAALDR